MIGVKWKNCRYCHEPMNQPHRGEILVMDVNEIGEIEAERSFHTDCFLKFAGRDFIPKELRNSICICCGRDIITSENIIIRNTTYTETITKDLVSGTRWLHFHVDCFNQCAGSDFWK